MSAGRFCAALLAVLAAGCADSSETDRAATEEPPAASTPTATAAPSGSRGPKPKALPGLPDFTAGYAEWRRLNRKPIPPREAGDAHLGTKNVYASKKRRPNGTFPYGTVVVKEATRPGRDFIGLIAVMRKERGADPAHEDWRFLEWTREARGERFTLTARDAVCWSCHVGAEGTDYLWIYTLGLAGR